MVPLVRNICTIGTNGITICSNGTNGTMGKVTKQWYHWRTPNIRTSKQIMRTLGVLNIGKNGTIGRQIPFKVLPMIPLTMSLVPTVPMLPTYGSK